MLAEHPTLNASRLPFVMLAMMCLLSELWTGLIRIGWGCILHSLSYPAYCRDSPGQRHAKVL